MSLTILLFIECNAEKHISEPAIRLLFIFCQEIEVFTKWCFIYLSTGVEITTAHSRTHAAGTTYKADVALMTLPLGVLKESLRGTSVNTVQFNPPLPSWKTEAIGRMGFGNLNKVCSLRCMELCLYRVHTCHGKPRKPGKILLSWNVIEMSWNSIFLEKSWKCHAILFWKNCMNPDFRLTVLWVI